MLEHIVDTQPDPYEGLSIGREAVAATAVCLRWGSYLAVLLDRAKPVCAQVQDPDHSRIADGEMARINIESSAALEQWIEILRRDSMHYQSLVLAAQRLPMPQKKVTRDPQFGHLLALSQPGITSFMDLTGHGEAYDRVIAHPTRTLANALISGAWRNGPVESIHAGSWGTYPLLKRRVTPREEQTLMRVTASRLAQRLLGFSTIDPSDVRPWVERILPYAFADQRLGAPRAWSLEEKSREVRLPGWEA